MIQLQPEGSQGKFFQIIQLEIETIKIEGPYSMEHAMNYVRCDTNPRIVRFRNKTNIEMKHEMDYTGV